MKALIENLESKQNLAYSFIRIFLGIALAVRGFMLMVRPESMSQWVAQEKMFLGYAAVAVIHLTAGIFLALGFLTRLAALMLLPVLVGAVFVIHAGEGLMTAGQSLELASLVLFLLLIYFVFGSGPYSIKLQG